MDFLSEPKSTFTFQMHANFFLLKPQQSRFYLPSMEETAIIFLLVCFKDTAISKQGGGHQAVYILEGKTNKI